MKRPEGRPEWMVRFGAWLLRPFGVSLDYAERTPRKSGGTKTRSCAKTFCRSFFRWYNAEHRHGGISMLTPEQVHFGNADQVIAGREAVLREAWAAHPDRFVSGEPKPKPLPEAVWINPPTPSLTTQDIAL